MSGQQDPAAGDEDPRRKVATTPVSVSLSVSTGASQQQYVSSPRRSPQGDTDDNTSFSDERFIHTTSWEEAPSFDSEAASASAAGGGMIPTAGSNSNRPSSRPSSRTQAQDRRKQFDTTTPTLIDEEEEIDEEQLRKMRRTPGTGLYKSSLFEPTADEAAIIASMRRTPAASPKTAESEIRGGVPETAKEAPGQTNANAGGTSTTGNDFGGSENPTQRRIVWETYPTTAAAAVQSANSPDATSPGEKNRPAASPSRQFEPKGPFSFAGPWAMGADAAMGERTTSGAFSPSILRLTEDIGNLLQEDDPDDDAYALGIPSVFRGARAASGNNDTAEAPSDTTDFDWTGSFVYDTERTTKRAAVPSRTSEGAEKAGSQRAEGREQHKQRQQETTSRFVPYTQQPKPRRNEVFEFGKQQHQQQSSSRATPSDERASPQLLSFGGAFAPPAAGTGGFSRPVASFQEATHFTEPQQQIQSSTPHFDISRPRFATVASGQPQPQQLQREGSFGAQGFTGIRSHAQSFDSYQSGQQAEGAYFQQSAYPPGFIMHGQPQTLEQQQQQQQQQQLSDMQATAQVFVPQGARSSTPHFPPQQQQQQQQQAWHLPQPGPGPIQHQQFDAPLDQGSWHSGGGYNYGGTSMNFGFSVQSPLSFDPRASMTPPPIQAWQQQPPPQQQQMPPPMMEQAVAYSTMPPQPQQQQQVRSDSGGAQALYAKASSPHPSLSSTDLSTANTQRGSKKETTKRKQRGGKKKTTKNEQLLSSATITKKGSTVPKKKSLSRVEASRPGSTSFSQDDINEDPQVFATEESVEDSRRSELVESPATRVAFKEFYRAFRGEERISFQRAEEFAVSALEDESLPESVHWRVYLELADLAKRSNRYVEARCLYQKVCQLQPYASQGWLEFSKLEEECGRMNRVMNILYKGLDYCQFSENLLNRAVKHHEKLGDLDNARGILARLKHVGIEKVWRTVLEGALLEARAGNIGTARRVLKYLMHHVPWYGPLYLEAYRLEKDQGHTLDALHVVERGLRAIPRYGPLWFGAFRLCEQMDISKKLYDLPSTMEMIERAAANISKELVWKVHLDAAQMLERAALEQCKMDDPAFDGLLAPARHRFATTILTCPNNLRWKVWLAAARMELGVGDPERARLLFHRAHQVVPKKGRSATLLECARLEDFLGDMDLARAILCKGRVRYGNDWKVWLESVMLEIRDGQVLRAAQLCDTALETHQGTGRLWATLVQLRQFQGRDEAQLATLKRALIAVPKSGEVWCEGGRVHLNPFSDTFDLVRARRHLHFATRFTPQYGDGFVEIIRLELIEQWLLPIASYIWEKTKNTFQSGRGGSAEAEGGLIMYITNVALAISVASQKEPEERSSQRNLPKLVHQNIVDHVRKQLQPETLRSTTDLNNVRLAGINADPNYGLLWFHCRQKITDSPRQIIEDAAEEIAEEVQTHAYLYLAAMIRRMAVLSTIPVEMPAGADRALETSDQNIIQWEDYIDKKLHAAPSLVHMFNPTDPTTGMDLFESTVSGPLFATGLTELNRHRSIANLSLTDRKRVLFGNESLFP